MSFLKKIADKAKATQDALSEKAKDAQAAMADKAKAAQAAMQEKAKKAQGSLGEKGGMLSGLTGGLVSLGGTGEVDPLGFTPEELTEVDGLLAGRLQSLSPEVVESRVERIKASGNPPYCSECTRILGDASKKNKSGLMSFAKKKHTAVDFLFPATSSLCVDCAIRTGVEIPCQISGQMFVPSVDKKCKRYGHTVICPEVRTQLDSGAVLGEDRSIRPAEPAELEAEKVITVVKRMFEADDVSVVPRLFFDLGPQPQWLLGHYAQIRAGSQGLGTLMSGQDDDGAIYVQIDHEYFIMSENNGGIELQMDVDPDHFDVESAGLISGALGGAAEGGIESASFRSKINIGKGSTGDNVALGMAAGAAAGLLRAGAERREAREAQAEVIRQYISTILDQMAVLATSELMKQEPKLIATVGCAPKRHVFQGWPDSADIGRASVC